MHELVKVTLENEMDLILAHKRSMKLAEIAGLSLSAQTTFATAVSEVARNTIDNGKSGCLILNVDTSQRERYIVACLKDEQPQPPTKKSREGLEYAKRLVNKYQVNTNGSETSIELFYYIAPSFALDIQKLDEWRSLFRNEPPISPYEELKRKNELLQELSEKIQKSEAQYKLLTNSLPLIIFSMDDEGRVLFANEWLLKFTGETVESLNGTNWKNVVHPDDNDSFSVLFQNNVRKGVTTIKTQSRLKHKSADEYLWHQVSVSPFKNEQGELQYWIGYMVDVNAQKIVAETQKDNIELKQTQEQLRENQHMLEKYIEQLNRSNQDLAQFAYAASHDLQEPVRKVLFYSDYLLNSYNDKLDKKGNDYLANMQRAANRMRELIRDILSFSQIDNEKAQFKLVDLNAIANDTLQDLEMVIEEKKAVINISKLPNVTGDERMLRQLFENIIGNSLKYSKPSVSPVIEIKPVPHNDSVQISFVDNGIGFDNQYSPQIFTLFQRLNKRQDYAGTGIGLAICKKIMDLHNGKIWANAEEGKGATFFISFPNFG
jgi:PAS domain S-box-containing protein